MDNPVINQILHYASYLLMEIVGEYSDFGVFCQSEKALLINM